MSANTSTNQPDPTEPDPVRADKDGRPKMPARNSDELSEKAEPVPERGGPKGAEPTRFGDWEKGGRCFDF